MPKKIDWYYHRKGCKTCAKSDAFLSQNSIEVVKQVDCKKEVYNQQQAGGLLDHLSQVLAVKGNAVKRFDASSPREEVLAAVIGPTGNLRAPSLRLGEVLIVGFDADLYREQMV